MSDYPALLAAVIAQPDEDTPRLVFADWFEENGQPERARYIRAAIAIANYGYTRMVCEKTFDPLSHAGGASLFKFRCRCRPCSLARREYLAGRRHAVWEWCVPIPPGWNSHYRRGFVESVRCTAADWLAHGDAVRRAQPVVRVKLTAFAAHECLERSSLDASRRRYAKFKGRDKWHQIPYTNATHDDYRRVFEAEWPGVTFELPAERFERGRIVTLPPDFLTRDYTEEGLQQMREAGRRAAEERERRNLETLLFNSTNPPR